LNSDGQSFHRERVASADHEKSKGAHLLKSGGAPNTTYGEHRQQKQKYNL